MGKYSAPTKFQSTKNKPEGEKENALRIAQKSYNLVNKGSSELGSGKVGTQRRTATTKCCRCGEMGHGWRTCPDPWAPVFPYGDQQKIVGKEDTDAQEIEVLEKPEVGKVGKSHQI